MSKYRYFGTLETLRNRGFDIVFRGVFEHESDPKRCKTGVNKNEHDFGPFFIETLYCIHARAGAGFRSLRIFDRSLRNISSKTLLSLKFGCLTMGRARRPFGSDRFVGGKLEESDYFREGLIGWGGLI